MAASPGWWQPRGVAPWRTERPPGSVVCCASKMGILQHFITKQIWIPWLFQSSSLSTKKVREKNPYCGAEAWSAGEQLFTWLKSSIFMPAPAVSSLPRITWTKRPWRKRLGHPFHIFQGKCFMNGMFAWTAPVAAGRTCSSVQRTLIPQAKKVPLRAGSGRKTTGVMGTAQSNSQDFCLGNYF